MLLGGYAAAAGESAVRREGRRKKLNNVWHTEVWKFVLNTLCWSKEEKSMGLSLNRNRTLFKDRDQDARVRPAEIRHLFSVRRNLRWCFGRSLAYLRVAGSWSSECRRSSFAIWAWRWPGMKKMWMEWFHWNHLMMLVGEKSGWLLTRKREKVKIRNVKWM